MTRDDLEAAFLEGHEVWASLYERSRYSVFVTFRDGRIKTRSKVPDSDPYLLNPTWRCGARPLSSLISLEHQNTHSDRGVFVWLFWTETEVMSQPGVPSLTNSD